ncbi:hypothetical protein K431DRAFT_300911 [Polychaeton citri CBS 116435]|uniref:HNH nuclease domain-containing protein n=1 Tax=Polychaeton citri CBS 116435 TaxID=1314669 RepID=A0A9P4UQJ4_9PEZI|nr:hypothetical protein K431DRAFT_300911 [Polychaeton citri CBS 116435]
MAVNASLPPAIRLRAPQVPFDPGCYPQIEARSLVLVRHPGYANGNNILLTLTSSDGDDSYYGVDFRLVHTACAIIADNDYNGWLSLSDDSSASKIALDDGAILQAGEYYYHVPYPSTASPAGAESTPNPLEVSPVQQSSRAYLYPVTPNFRAWKYIEDLHHFARAWNSTTNAAVAAPIPPISNLAAKVTARDGSCRLTASRLMTEVAHMVPAAEKEWFARNRMDQYRRLNSTAERQGPDTDGNAILLRADVHALWDRRYFTLVPKFAEGSWTMVAHTTERLSELHEKFHNIPLQLLRDISPQCLFARFAHDLFPSMINFLSEGRHRRLAVYNTDGSKDCNWYSPDDCQRFCEGQGQGRSASPKRKRRDPDAVTETGITDRIDSPCEEDTGGSGESEDFKETPDREGWDDSCGYKRRLEQEELQEAMDESIGRGRKRTRTCDRQSERGYVDRQVWQHSIA